MLFTYNEHISYPLSLSSAIVPKSQTSYLYYIFINNNHKQLLYLHNIYRKHLFMHLFHYQE
jgi:hypothetical protein